MIRPAPLASPRLRRALGGAALGLALLAAGGAAASSTSAIPGPPLEPAAMPGAYCLPGGDGGLGAAGFAGAVAATALLARQRRPSS